ncbi:MAG TPA: ABC transporter substrate-binding protein [Patescibacteria group bacterium]|nr:ABC transporter substrate-binding protein [Patescibacteria group bacterium]
MNDNHNPEKKDKKISFLETFSLLIQKSKEKLQKKEKESWNKRLVGKITSKKKIPNVKQIKKLPALLTKTERNIIKILCLVIVMSAGFLAIRFYFENSTITPTYGGEYIEGLVGEPQFINPVLAGNSEVDSDLSSLVFSGLLKFNEKLELETDLALSYEIIDDRLQYIFYLNENVFWHDGEKFTAHDVVFTVNTIKDPTYLSPLQPNFRGVKVEALDDTTVMFTLTEPFAPFINSLTFGILPQHKWGDVAPKNFTLSKLNLNPIGTGPFVADKFKRDDLGNFRSYTLVRNENSYADRAYIEKVTFKFYPTIDSAVEGLLNNHVHGVSVLPKEYRLMLSDNPDFNYYSLFLPQYTALFFNLRDSELLKDAQTRNALATAINRDEIISIVFGGEAEIINGPILPGFIGYNERLSGAPFSPEEANRLLDEEGWKRITPEEYFEIIRTNTKKEVDESEDSSSEASDSTIAAEPETGETVDTSSEETAETTEDTSSDDAALEALKQQEFYRQKGNLILELNITTVAHPENLAVAQMIAENWRAAGVRVDLFSVDAKKINTEVIKPRLYNVLLYAEVVGSDPDPYPYWHSSQVKDPGLNLSLFSHSKVDKLIEDARITSDPSKREEFYFAFQDILVEEVPAIFLYYPTYNYVVNEKVKNVRAQIINLPSDRFSDMEKRYIKIKHDLNFENWREFFASR